MKPRPLVGLIAALVAHVAFLQAPDAITFWGRLAWYVLAIGGTLVVAHFLNNRLGKTEGESAPIGTEAMGLFCEALIFVGAGYSTKVEPGVIKLHGILPLGWSCAVMGVIVEHMRLSARTRGLKCLQGWHLGNRWPRLHVLALAAFAQAAVNIASPASSDDAGILRVWLLLILITSSLDVLINGRRLSRV